MTDAWSRATPPGVEVGVAYLSIENDGTDPERLVAVHSPIAAAAEVHESTIYGGVMQMERIDVLSLAPGEQVVLAPGGIHLMLMGLTEPLSEGDHFSLVLTFEPAGDVAVDVEVRGQFTEF